MTEPGFDDIDASLAKVFKPSGEQLNVQFPGIFMFLLGNKSARPYPKFQPGIPPIPDMQAPLATL
jgi:hypothetical protein